MNHFLSAPERAISDGRKEGYQKAPYPSNDLKGAFKTDHWRDGSSLRH